MMPRGTHHDPERPRAILLAGPNGAGKSTFAGTLLDQLEPKPVSPLPFLNADLIAAELAPEDPASVALEAGRRFLRQLDEFARARRDFAFESTLSGRRLCRRLADLKNDGYQLDIFFLWLPDDETAIERVAGRVRHGGHHVPEDVIRRRRRRGLRNFHERARPLADGWRLYDGSLEHHLPRLVAASQGSATPTIYDESVWSRFRWQLGLHEISEPPAPPYTDPWPDGAFYDEVMRQACRKAVEIHRAAGVDLVFWSPERGTYCVSPEDLGDELDDEVEAAV